MKIFTTYSVKIKHYAHIFKNTVRIYRDAVDMLIEISGTNAEVISDKKLFRVADEPLLLGDDTKIKALGYKRKYSMQQTLEDVYHDWESRI